MYLTFFSSNFKMFSVTVFNRFTSWLVSPKLFTNSILRNDSVVEPAKAVVSPKIDFETVLIFLLKNELTTPKIGTMAKNRGAITQ